MSASNIQTKKNKKTICCPPTYLDNMMSLFSVPAGGNNETVISMYIIRYLNEHNISYYIDAYNNIIARKGSGQTFATYVCHIDTVHDYTDGYHVAMSNRHIIAYNDSQTQIGCGGDDKCGVWTCLQLLIHVDNVLCVFFSREETGGEGSTNIDIDVFSRSRFIAGIDRWGNCDIVNEYYGEITVSDEFMSRIKKVRKAYGYTYNYGMFTDALNLYERDVGLSCINVSCGYYAHHSSQEYVDVDELYTCLLLCIELSTLTDIFYHTGTPSKKQKSFTPRYLGGYHSSNEEYCSECGTILYADETGKCGTCRILKPTTCDYCEAELFTEHELKYRCCAECEAELLELK